MSRDPADPIRPEHDQFTEALKNGDVEAIVALAAEDCVFMPPNDTSLYGPEEVRDWFGEYFRHFRIAVLEETERAVTPMGDRAFDRWSYAVAILPTNGGDRIRDDGRAVVLWERVREDTWKMAQLIFNSMRPIGSGTSRFMVRMMEHRRPGFGGSGQGD